MLELEIYRVFIFSGDFALESELSLMVSSISGLPLVCFDYVMQTTEYVGVKRDKERLENSYRFVVETFCTLLAFSELKHLTGKLRR